MKKIVIYICTILMVLNIQAKDNTDALDMLDKQSQDFFKAVTGLEKSYLEEQVIDNQKKKNIQPINKDYNNTPILIDEIKIPEEQKEKNVFMHANDMARISSDFAKTKKLKDIKIKSIYSFNGNTYVILQNKQNSFSSNKELSLNIEGRYKKGDYILNHKIISINRRTKTIYLYKKLDKEYSYTVYLSNYGVSISDLKKKDLSVKKEKKINIKEKYESSNLNKIAKKQSKIEEQKLCRYKVKAQNLNVREEHELDSMILRILRKNDTFTIVNKFGEWVQIDTIYKDISGDVMLVKEENNWLQIIDNNVSSENKNCL